MRLFYINELVIHYFAEKLSVFEILPNFPSTSRSATKEILNTSVYTD